MNPNKTMTTTLERFRAEARCANELGRGHLLWRLGQELGVAREVLLEMGFDTVYRQIVEEESRGN